ncbi:hypothetical protein NE865_03012 [Phthorimaea operculella]|nr:hypothetical protein NE865_03012 [Phthorimaea operculella]
MVNCNSCGNEALDYIQCSQCQNVYDYGDCSGITEAGYQGLGPDRQAVWKCPTCKQGKVKKPKKTKDNPGSVSPNAISLDRVMEELNKIKLSLAPLLNVMDGIREIKDEISDVKSSMKIYSDKLDSLEGRLISVEKACDAAGKLEDRISALEADLNEKNQWARLNNVEIKGVPLKDRENLLEIVSRIGTKISYPISKQNINFVARVPSQDNKLKPIIVSFVNRGRRGSVRLRDLGVIGRDDDPMTQSLVEPTSPRPVPLSRVPSAPGSLRGLQPIGSMVSPLSVRRAPQLYSLLIYTRVTTENTPLTPTHVPV